MFQEIGFLPAEVIIRHVKNHFMPAVGIDGLCLHAFSAKMHMGGIGQNGDIFGQSET